MNKVFNNMNDNKIVEICTKEPLLIKNVETNKNPIWDIVKKIGAIIGLIGGLLGLIVTVYVINDRWYKDPEIYSKIISYASADGEFEIMKIRNTDNSSEMIYGAKYFLKLSINVTDKDLNYRDLEVFVRYNNIDKVYKGVIYSPRNYSDWTIGNKPLVLKLPQENLLYYKSVLKKNTTHLEYLTFIVYNKNEKYIWEDDTIPELIQLKFISSELPLLKKGNKTFISNSMYLDKTVEKYIWEDEIWIER